MRALVLVDIQNDFCPGGSLAVSHGNEVVAVANRLSGLFDIVVATRDWHPVGHGSFATSHPGRQPGEVIDLNGVQQILWPDHCVQGTPGAEFVAGLDTSPIMEVFEKGIDPGVDSYSTFFDNARRRDTGLAGFLRQRGVEDVVLLGLATDYCVQASALDAVHEGFRTEVVVDGCRGVELQPGDTERALSTMEEAGVKLLSSRDLLPYDAALGKGRYLELVEREGYEFARRVGINGIVVLVAVTRDDCLLLVEQHREPVAATVVELPAGLAGDDVETRGESLERAAQRELEEETGYRAQRFEYLVKGPVSAGFGTEVLTFLRAHDLEKVGPGGGVDNEDIEVFEVPVPDVPAFLQERQRLGRLVDPKVYAGLYFASR